MSAKEQKFIITVKDGSVRPNKDFRAALNGLTDGRYQISLKRYQKQRSLSQNSYYFGVVVNAVKDGLIDMGFNPSDLSNEIVHEMLKAKFLKQDIANDEGLFVEIVRSTADLTTTEFMTYIEEIQQWAASFLNIYIPEPNEQSELNF